MQTDITINLSKDFDLDHNMRQRMSATPSCSMLAEAAEVLLRVVHLEEEAERHLVAGALLAWAALLLHTHPT